MDFYPLQESAPLFQRPQPERMELSRLLKQKGAAISATLLLSSLLTVLPANAQIVDPTEAMILNAARHVDPVAPEAKPNKLPSKKSASGKPVEPLPPTLQSQLDLSTTEQLDEDDALPPPPPAGDAIQAKAVMVDINSKTLNYDKDHDVYVATGAVHMIISEQNSELYADKLTYDQNQDLAIAEGHVVIVKDGKRTEGSYAKIDLTRKSALINDPVTTISAVRVKANQSFVNANEIQLENGRMIISGLMYQNFVSSGGLANIGQNTGKRAGQARLNREYTKQMVRNRDMLNQFSYDQQQTIKSLQGADLSKDGFDENKVSLFNLKAKEIEVVRHGDGYDKITLQHPSLYAGKFKLLNVPDTDFSYDQNSKEVQYLGPDIGANRGYGGAYLGPGWDFHLGKGSLRLSPLLSYGSPGFWSSNGKTGKQISNGLGFGGALHFRDPDTTLDMAYNSHVGSPIFFGDRRLFGDSTHLMASYNDVYSNGLLGQLERPTYIAQVTDYRMLKSFSKFALTSFESLGYAKDNFYPNFRKTYFVEAKGLNPQTLGRAQLQLQLQNTAPLIRIGKYASVGMRAQLLSAAYTSSDFIALGRIGPTLSLNLLDSRLQSTLAYTLSHTLGKSPFVFDSYYGGAQNLQVSNLLRINKYLSIGNTGSFSLNRDNARNALAVANTFYMMVGPPELKASIGYDFVNSRSYFGFNFYPGSNNTVVKFDKMRIVEPSNFTPTGKSKF